MKTILMCSQTTLMASTLSLLQAQSSLFLSVIGLQPACFCLQTARNKLDRACNRPATGLFSSAIGLQQAQSSLLQADCRQKQAGCRLVATSIFLRCQFVFSFKREESFWEQKLFKNFVFFLHTCSNVKLYIQLNLYKFPPNVKIPTPILLHQKDKFQCRFF